LGRTGRREGQQANTTFFCENLEVVLQAYIDTTAQTALDEYRTDLGSLLSRSERSIKIEPDRAVWWTFAGGQINHTLKYGIQFQSLSEIY
jgi:ATP-dependent Lhr-like helicase